MRSRHKNHESWTQRSDHRDGQRRYLATIKRRDDDKWTNIKKMWRNIKQNAHADKTLLRIHCRHLHCEEGTACDKSSQTCSRKQGDLCLPDDPVSSAGLRYSHELGRFKTTLSSWSSIRVLGFSQGCWRKMQLLMRPPCASSTHSNKHNTKVILLWIYFLTNHRETSR